jgi:hypothetical protein
MTDKPKSKEYWLMLAKLQPEFDRMERSQEMLSRVAAAIFPPSSKKQIEKQRAKPGPKPGATGNKADQAQHRSLFPEITRRLKSGEYRSLTSITNALASEGKVAGIGAQESRARTLARADRRQKAKR